MKKIMLILSFNFLVLTTKISFAQWTPDNNGLANINIGCFAISGINIFAGANFETKSYGVFLSTDNGESWNTVNNGLPDSTYVSSLAISGKNIFVGTLTKGVYLSTNNGGSWKAVNKGLESDIYSDTTIDALTISGENIFAGTLYGVFLSTNNGESWSAVNNGLTNNIVKCFAISGTNIFVGTSFNGVYLSTDNGGSWNAINNGLNGYDAGISLAIKGGDIFAGTQGGGVFLSTNNGTNWTTVNNGMNTLNSNLVICLAISGINIFAGTLGGVFLSTNNGESWSSMNNGFPYNTEVFSFVINEGYIFAGTNNGLWKYNLTPTEQICYVEFDTASSKNSINWATNLPTNIDSVHIYDQVSTTVWKKIGTVSARKSNFIDMNSNPFNQSYSYKISVKDTLGYESDTSAFHTTITLLAAYNSGTKTYGFTWSAYQGLTIENYYLFGIKANGKDSLIATLPGNQYFYNYINPYAGFVNYFVGFYTAPCNSKSNYLVKSNYALNTTGINELTNINEQVTIYPNPANSLIVVSCQFIENSKPVMEMFDITGKLIKTQIISGKLTNVDISDLAEGVYIVKVTNENGVAENKFIKL